jgi:ParB-like chromosome segregation protein Spo0J
MIRLVPTNKIVPHPTHTLIEQDKIDKYRKLLRDGSAQPPLLVSKLSDGRYQIQDGHHRWISRQREGFAETEVIIFNDLVETDEHGGAVIRAWR